MSVPYLTETPAAQACPYQDMRFRRPLPAFAAVAVLAALAVVASLALAASASAAGTLFIRGGGFGHGVGMSQYGSYGYALHGRSYRWILAHYYQGTKLGTVGSNRRVRVLLGTSEAAFAGATRAGNKKLRPSVTYTVQPLADGSINLRNPKGKKVGHFTAPLTATGPGPLALAGSGSYRGSLVFTPNGRGGVDTVDSVGLEDYVRGVISWEMPSSWAAEALKVQAVAARTFAITNSVGGSLFDVYADTRSQEYGGVAAETPSTDAAVAATRGQVVTYHGSPVITYFSSSSGGHTENVENVFAGSTPDPWLRGVPDPYDGAAGNPNHRWQLSPSLPAASAALGRLVKGQLVGIKVLEHGASPRILLADVVGTAGVTQVTGEQLQHAFDLKTTYASFTTISSFNGPPKPTLTDRRRGGALKQAQRAEAEAVLALVPLVRRLVSGAVPGIHGSVYPAPRGSRVAVQERGSRGWRTVAHASVRSDGAYGLRVPGPGTYRVVYRGFDGPAVAIA
jgi:stage II sporulation protein D